MLQQEQYPAIWTPCWHPRFGHPWGYPPKWEKTCPRYGWNTMQNFSVLCMHLNFRHRPLPLGYRCAKFCFFRGLHCWARPWRKIAYSITQSLTQLIWCSGNWSLCYGTSGPQKHIGKPVDTAEAASVYTTWPCWHLTSGIKDWRLKHCTIQNTEAMHHVRSWQCSDINEVGFQSHSNSAQQTDQLV